MSALDTLSHQDKDFLIKCEEELKDRYTEKDEEFMKVFNSEASKPPIIESWWVPRDSGRRNDRRNTKRYHPYEHGNRDRNYQGRRDNYEGRRDNHEGRRDNYEGRRDNYEGRRDNYDRRDYNRGNDDRRQGHRNQRTWDY